MSTGKTAKKLATKAAEKLVEKGAEKIGEKTGQLVGEKIYDKFSTKPGRETTRDASHPAEDRPPEIKGKEIGKMLAASSHVYTMAHATPEEEVALNEVMQILEAVPDSFSPVR